MQTLSKLPYQMFWVCLRLYLVHELHHRVERGVVFTLLFFVERPFLLLIRVVVSLFASFSGIWHTNATNKVQELIDCQARDGDEADVLPTNTNLLNPPLVPVKK